MTSRSSWIDSFSESAMATIRPMFAASPGNCGWLRIASRIALARGLDPGVAVITLLSPPGSHLAPGRFAPRNQAYAIAALEPGRPIVNWFECVRIFLAGISRRRRATPVTEGD